MWADFPDGCPDLLTRRTFYLRPILVLFSRPYFFFFNLLSVDNNSGLLWGLSVLIYAKSSVMCLEGNWLYKGGWMMIIVSILNKIQWPSWGIIKNVFRLSGICGSWWLGEDQIIFEIFSILQLKWAGNWVRLSVEKSPRKRRSSDYMRSQGNVTLNRSHIYSENKAPHIYREGARKCHLQ